MPFALLKVGFAEVQFPHSGIHLAHAGTQARGHHRAEVVPTTQEDRCALLSAPTSATTNVSSVPTERV